MAEEKRTTWQEFEALVERLHRGLHRGAKITRDDRILGVNSRCKRQIDIAIRHKVGPNDILIIVECKRRSRKVDIDGMNAFAAAREDVRAHLGIMVSEKGFTNGARHIAEKN